jgi:hypothetical protein
MFRKPKSQCIECNNKRVKQEDGQDHCVQEAQTTE